MGRRGVFDGHPIVGAVVGDASNPVCDTSTGAQFGRVYRADVRKYLLYDVDASNKAAANNGVNGTHFVSLLDRGNSNSGLLTNGASLIIIYRTVVPGNPQAVPLSAVVMYDGAFSVNKSSGKLDQTIAGYYQAYQNAANNIITKITPVIGNGQPGYVSSLNVTTSDGPGNFNKPFTGTAGPRWDSTTFNIQQKLNASNYSFHVTFAASVCLTLRHLLRALRS